MTARDSLLEIFSETLPSSGVRPAADQLKRLAGEEFSRRGLPVTSVEAYGTSRRLVLYASGLPAGALSVRALSEIFPLLLGRLEFARTMSWEASGFGFPAPVRSLLALHGERLVSFSAAGLKSGRVTEGLESLGPRRLSLPSAEKYFKTLEHASVLVKDGERLAAMRAGLDSASRRMRLGVEAHEDTLRENLYSAEYPVPVVSGFAQEFLALPPERLRSALRSLMFFPVSDDDGRLQPYFAAFRDGVSKGQRNVEDPPAATTDQIVPHGCIRSEVGTQKRGRGECRFAPPAHRARHSPPRTSRLCKLGPLAGFC